MAPLIDECLDLLAERIQEQDITLHWQPPAEPDGIAVEGNDGELQQVLDTFNESLWPPAA